jgi:hypothetical protein
VRGGLAGGREFVEISYGDKQLLCRRIASLSSLASHTHKQISGTTTKIRVFKVPLQPLITDTHHPCVRVGLGSRPLYYMGSEVVVPYRMLYGTGMNVLATAAGEEGFESLRTRCTF